MEPMSEPADKADDRYELLSPDPPMGPGSAGLPVVDVSRKLVSTA